MFGFLNCLCLTALSRFSQALTDSPIVIVLFSMTSVTYWNLTKHSAKCFAASREKRQLIFLMTHSIFWPCAGSLTHLSQWHINTAQFTLLLFLCLLILCRKLQPKLLFSDFVFFSPSSYVQPILYSFHTFFGIIIREDAWHSLLLIALCQQVKRVFFEPKWLLYLM